MKTLQRSGSMLVLAAFMTFTAVHAWAGPFTSPGIDSKAPGLSGISAVISAIMGYLLAACLAGFLLSLIAVVVGPLLGFDRAGQIGKAGLLVSVGVAFLAGGVTVFLNWAYAAGSS